MARDGFARGSARLGSGPNKKALTVKITSICDGERRFF